MRKDSYYKFCFYWFGIFEGLLATISPSIILFLKPKLNDIFSSPQSLDFLNIYFSRSFNSEAIAIGGILLVMSIFVKELKAHMGILGFILLGDILYLYTIYNVCQQNASLSCLAASSAIAFGITALFATVRLLVITLLYFNRITD